MGDYESTHCISQLLKERVPELHEVIRQIRVFHKMSQAFMASWLGVDQSAVSQYERGQIRPSLEVLMRVYGLAPRGDERDFIRDCITAEVGHIPPELEAKLIDKVRFDQAFRSGIVSPDRIQRLLDQLQQLIDEARDIDASIVELIRLYRMHRSNPKIRKAFERFVAWLEVELEVKPEVEEKAKQEPTKRTRAKKSA